MNPPHYLSLWALLSHKAAERQTITYGQIVSELALPVLPIGLGGPLTKVSQASHDLVGVLLSVIAVNAETQLPAESFFDLARSKNPDNQNLDNAQIFEAEFEKVCAVFKN